MPVANLPKSRGREKGRLTARNVSSCNFRKKRKSFKGKGRTQNIMKTTEEKERLDVLILVEGVGEFWLRTKIPEVILRGWKGGSN